MIADEKPLHVRVAEALGWTECIPFSVYGVENGEWTGDRPQPGPKSWEHADGGFIPRYDTDWSATGPLIEKYGIGVDQRASGRWYATSIDPDGIEHRAPPQHGLTPLLAVCRLILALKEAGKL